MSFFRGISVLKARENIHVFRNLLKSETDMAGFTEIKKNLSSH